MFDLSTYIVLISDIFAFYENKKELVKCALDADNKKEDDKKKLPVPTKPNELSLKPGEVISLVDIDFTEYRRKNEMRVVKKNCTLPSWLNYEAERAHINFSALLQRALKQELHIAD